MATGGVILLHGIARGAAAMRPLERALRGAGYRTLNLDYPARRHDIATLAGLVADRSRAFATGCESLHFVAHSMGGLVARALIGARRPPNLGRVVMLGPPNQGSEIADHLDGVALYHRAFGPAGRELSTAARATCEPIDYPIGIIAGTRAFDLVSWALLPKPNDGKVTVARTKLPGMTDHLVLPATHTLMMRHPGVIRATLAFLRDGRF